VRLALDEAGAGKRRVPFSEEGIFRHYRDWMVGQEIGCGTGAPDKDSKLNRSYSPRLPLAKSVAGSTQISLPRASNPSAETLRITVHSPIGAKAQPAPPAKSETRPQRNAIATPIA
jgi:hypothetical protein